MCLYRIDLSFILIERENRSVASTPVSGYATGYGPPSGYASPGSGFAPGHSSPGSVTTGNEFINDMKSVSTSGTFCLLYDHCNVFVDVIKQIFI